MTIDGEDDLEGLRRAGRGGARGPGALPGARRAHGARSAPRAVGFPAATCVSVNDEAAHGIPSPARVLRVGDLVNVDVSAELDGYWADTGASAPVGAVTRQAERLLAATREAQADAMAAARAGRPMRHVGRAVQRCARRHGFTVIANLCGHGVGGSLHESPSVPSIEDPADRTMLWEGLVLAVEPFLATGGTHAWTDADGWTLRTDDGSLAAQFEHTIVVTGGRPLVLTASGPAQSSRL